MSINSKQSIKCPECNQLNEVTSWSMITVKDSPDLKEDLLKAKINIFKCDSCQTQRLLPNPLLYHDEDMKLLISFTPCNEQSEKYALYENVKQTSKESGELRNFDNYNLRFVTNYDELLEKILIFDNGFHDKVVEVLKLLILMQEPEKADNRIAVFGKVTNDNIEFLVKDNTENAFYTSNVPLSTYDTVKQQLQLSGVKYRSFDWEIVDLNYASSLLRGMNNIL